MGRFYIENNQIIDNDNKIKSIDMNNIDIDELVCTLNKMELDKLEYKRELKTLKHRIRRMIE